MNKNKYNCSNNSRTKAIKKKLSAKAVDNTHTRNKQANEYINCVCVIPSTEKFSPFASVRFDNTLQSYKCLPELFELIPNAPNRVSFHLCNWLHPPWLLWHAPNHDNLRASLCPWKLIQNYAFSFWVFENSTAIMNNLLGMAKQNLLVRVMQHRSFSVYNWISVCKLI